MPVTGAYTVVDGPYTKSRDVRPAGRTVQRLVLHDPGANAPKSDVLHRVMLGMGTSYHEVFGPRRDGSMAAMILVPAQDVAWHAGARTKLGVLPWSGSAVNLHTYGACIVYPADAQTVGAFVQRVVDLCRQFRLSADDVLAHHEVATARADPRPFDIRQFREWVRSAL